MTNTLDYYLQLSYPMEIIEDKEEGGYAVSFPDLPGCLTCGDTIEEALKNAADAKLCWLEAALEEGIPIATPRERNSYSGNFSLRIPKSLHKSLAEQAKKEGVSMNQYCTVLLSCNHTLTSVGSARTTKG